MATFLTRAFAFETAQAAGFADTVGNFHGAGIDALAESGITGGCATDPLRYCPGEAATRAQMATFLARVLGLVPLPEMVAPAGSRLAYTQVSGAVSSVIVVDADGSDSRSLGTGALGPMWSPDGTRILYRDVPWPDHGVWPTEIGLWVVGTDGSDRRKVAAGGPHPVWSPDGSRILYRDRDSSGDWWVVGVAGTDRRRIGPAAVWSPDGSRIVYSSGDGMFVTDVTGGSTRRIAEVGSDGSDRRRLGTGLGRASLSPDATRIAWNGEDGGVWVMNTDGSGRTQLTQDGWRPVWAPDGGRLATYHDSEGWPYSLVVVDVDGWVLAEITPGNVFGPVWLPDNRSVAYSADDVFIADIEGGTRRLTNHDTFDTITCLVPSPAGDQLAYRTGNGVYVVNTDGTDHTRLDRHGECPTWSPG